MKNLRLRIDKEIESDGGPPPTVFATITSLDPSSGRRVRDTKPLRESVPISLNPADVRSVPLNPGYYLVEIALPSGEVLSDQITMPANADADLVLKAEASPHEWLSWQHLMGNVNAPSSLTVRRSSGAAARRSSRKSAKADDAAYDMLGATPAGVAPAPAAPVIAPGVFWLPVPAAGLLGGANPDAWTTLGALADAKPLVLESLNSGVPLRPIPAYTQDDERAVFRVVHGPAATSSATPLSSPLQRDFIAFPDRGTVELLSLPTPWDIVASGREAVIEVIVQQTANVNEFASSISVRDDRLGVFLGYLQSGSLSAVREIAEDAKDLLYEKTINPLAAVAGGYAMVATATDDKDHDWHGWVTNLATMFPQIPDGAILCAQLRLRLRRNPQDLVIAAGLLKDAYRRGLPYYTTGIRWLLDGLEKLGTRDPELEAMRRAVSGIAWRLHPQSAFTILHIGPR